MIVFLLLTVIAYSGHHVYVSADACSSLAVPYNTSSLDQLVGRWYLVMKRLANFESKEKCGFMTISVESHPGTKAYRYERYSIPDESFSYSQISRGLVAENPQTGEIVLVETSPDSGFTTFYYVSKLVPSSLATLFSCDFAANPMIWVREPSDSVAILNAFDGVERLGVTDLYSVSQMPEQCAP